MKSHSHMSWEQIKEESEKIAEKEELGNRRFMWLFKVTICVFQNKDKSRLAPSHQESLF